MDSAAGCAQLLVSGASSSGCTVGSDPISPPFRPGATPLTRLFKDASDDLADGARPASHADCARIQEGRAGRRSFPSLQPRLQFSERQ